MIELLNILLYDYFHGEGTFETYDYVFLKDLSRIITTPKFSLEPQTYRTHTRIHICFHLAHDFLSRLDPRYGNYLEKILMSGQIQFYERNGYDRRRLYDCS